MEAKGSGSLRRERTGTMQEGHWASSSGAGSQNPVSSSAEDIFSEVISRSEFRLQAPGLQEAQPPRHEQNRGPDSEAPLRGTTLLTPGPREAAGVKIVLGVLEGQGGTVGRGQVPGRSGQRYVGDARTPVCPAPAWPWLPGTMVSAPGAGLAGHRTRRQTGGHLWEASWSHCLHPEPDRCP